MLMYDIIRNRIKNDELLDELLCLREELGKGVYDLDDYLYIKDWDIGTYIGLLLSLKTGMHDFYWLYLINCMKERNIHYIYEWKHIEEFVKGLEYEDELLECFELNRGQYECGGVVRDYSLYKAFDISSAVYMGTKYGNYTNESMISIVDFYIKNNRDFNDFDWG